jgi:hypothetical protein
MEYMIDVIKVTLAVTACLIYIWGLLIVLGMMAQAYVEHCFEVNYRMMDRWSGTTNYPMMDKYRNRVKRYGRWADRIDQYFEFLCVPV